LQIPDNIKIFNDVVFVHPLTKARVGIQYKEVVKKGAIHFKAYVDKEWVQPTQKGHLEVTAALEADASSKTIYALSEASGLKIQKMD